MGIYIIKIMDKWHLLYLEYLQWCQA